MQVSVFHEVQRLLREGGTCFIVVGDTSNNYSPVRAKGQRKGRDKQWLMRRSLEINYREKAVFSPSAWLRNYCQYVRRDRWLSIHTLAAERSP